MSNERENVTKRKRKEGIKGEKGQRVYKRERAIGGGGNTSVRMSVLQSQLLIFKQKRKGKKGEII